MSGELLLMQAAGLFGPGYGFDGCYEPYVRKCFCVEQLHSDGVRAKIFEGDSIECRDYVTELQDDPRYAGCNFDIVSS